MAKAHLGGCKSPRNLTEFDIATVVTNSRLDSEEQHQQEFSNNSKLISSPNVNRSILADIGKETQNTPPTEYAINIQRIQEDRQEQQHQPQHQQQQQQQQQQHQQQQQKQNNAIGNISIDRFEKNNGNQIATKTENNKKINFRASQQFLHKKKWKTQFMARYQKGNQKQQQPQQLLLLQQQQQQQQVNKADMENVQNIKNQIKYHNNKQQQLQQLQQQHHILKNLKQTFNNNKKLLNRSSGAPFSIRSKFFLPDKRPRKEVIIPPTKFLLGGNISDPLNLNSLQDEALNATPTQTPKQSPITTPPKVEVIIPPNIHDPLHLLDPVDSVEYEKLLVSPMKRKSKSKHRNRKKKKPKKRKRFGKASSSSSPFLQKQQSSIVAAIPTPIIEAEAATPAVTSTDTPLNSTTTTTTTTTTAAVDSTISSGTNSCSTTCTITSNEIELCRARRAIIDDRGDVSIAAISGALLNDAPKATTAATTTTRAASAATSIDKDWDSYGGGGLITGEPLLSNEQKYQLESSNSNGHNVTVCFGAASAIADSNQNSRSCGGGGGNIQKGNQDSAQKSNNTNSLINRRNTDREKATRDLRLDLGVATELQQQQQNQQQFNTGSGGGSVVGRKRKISEGLNSSKNKFRRLDSMDKIVSPVIPQPGAWKRPPRTVPSGARKLSRVRSSSVSETELISPTDEIKTIESESIRGDTPDVESTSKQDDGSTTTTTPTTEGIFVKKPKFRPEGVKYQYGNYNRYPGYRYLNEYMDVRLQVFQRNAHFFRKKDVLDIGCNVGHITIAVAKDLKPKSILGVDIDRQLIMKARKNLSMYVRIPKDEEEKHEEKEEESKNKEENIKLEKDASSTMEATTSNKNELPSSVSTKNNSSRNDSTTHKNETLLLGNNMKKMKKMNFKRKMFNNKIKPDEDKNDFFPISFPMCLGSIPNVDSKKDEVSPSSASSPNDARTIVENKFPENVFFRAQNYVLPDESLLSNDTQQYDLILCLSVTKWIHLNFGDAGLKLAFKRMFNQLRPGGKLILEAQNWASYKKKKNLTETIYNNYKNIEFFPNKFHEYLLSNEVGFSHSYTLGVPRHLSKGFCRPIQLYAKGDFTPNHIRWSDTYYPQTPYEAYRGIYASMPRPRYYPWSCDTPHHGGNSSSYSCRQTPMHQPTSQYYNPLETDSYLPSYNTEILNHHYVFASPLYQTVWSPPASLRNSSSHTPMFGSVRESDFDDGIYTARHVYPPNEDYYNLSPQVNSGGAFNSIRETDSEECCVQEQQQRRHVYATYDGSSSPKSSDAFESSPDAVMIRNNQEVATDEIDEVIGGGGGEGEIIDSGNENGTEVV